MITTVWTKEMEDTLKLLYDKGLPYKEIAEKMGLKTKAIQYKVRKLDFPPRGKGKFKKFNNVFLNQTPERDYWLGYIFADGHVHIGWLQLCSVNKEVVDTFKEFCKDQCTITSEEYKVNNGDIHIIYKANIYSKTFTKWFMEYFNIESTKHHTLNPNIEMNWDIFRGYFDGDGSAHIKGGLTINSSSKKWIDTLQKFLENEVNVVPQINQYLECYKLCVWKKEDLKKIIPLMYNTNYFYLKYKKEKFEPFISNDNRKQDELLEPCDGNQQPSQPLTKLEGSETNS